MFLDHIQRRSTVGRGLCDELITRPEESYRLWCVVVCDLETSRIGAPYMYDITNLRVKHGNESQGAVKRGEFFESQRTFSFSRCVLRPPLSLLAS